LNSFKAVGGGRRGGEKVMITEREIGGSLLGRREMDLAEGGDWD